MKKAIFSLVAIVLAAAMVFTFAACGGKDEPETTAPEVTDAAVDAVVESDETTVAEETSAEETTVEETTVEETTVAEAAAPETKADIVALYNEATANAVDSKSGFNKTVTTELQDLQMGAIGKIEAVRDAVGGFLGEGTETIKAKKGTASEELVKSTLKESDVTDAKCELSADGKYYEVTITVKNETDPAKGKSALNRFTNDYKDNQEMVDGLASEGASTGTIQTTVKTATIKAKIAVESKEISSLDYTLKIDCLLTKVKYMVSVKQVTGTIYTTVSYSDFSY